MKSYLSLIPISAKVRRQQNRMTLLCIIISVFLVTAIFSVAEAFVRTENQIMRNKHGSWHIQITELSPDIADGISRRPDVTVMGWWDRINFDATDTYLVGKRRAALYGTDEAYFSQLMNGLEEGAFPQRDDEVVLNPDAKIALDVGIGDRVTVHTPAGDAEFTVSGFGTDDSDYYKGQTFMVAVYMTRNAFHTLMAQNGLSESPVCTIQFQSAEKASKARAELRESYGVPKETISENKAIMGIAGQSDNEAISGIYVIAIFLFPPLSQRLAIPPRVWLIGSFVAYFVLLPWLTKGYTPGCLLLKFRITNDDGTPPNPWRLLLRHSILFLVEPVFFYMAVLPLSVLLLILVSVGLSWKVRLALAGCCLLAVWLCLGFLIRCWNRWGVFPHSHYSRTKAK